MSIYYGLRKGSYTGIRKKHLIGQRYVPTFAEALEKASPLELQKAIAHLEGAFPKLPSTYSFKAQRIERMKQRLHELQ